MRLDLGNHSGLISRFKAELESLHGRFYLTSTREAVEMIAKIAEEKRVKLAVKSNVPFEDQINLAGAFSKIGISLVDIGAGNQTNVTEIITKADMGLSGADLAIAETGTIAIVTRMDADRLVTCLPPVHLALVPSSVLVRRPKDALPLLQQEFRGSQPSVVSFVSGPSRTGDVEVKLVLGVHGPHEVHVVMLEDR